MAQALMAFQVVGAAAQGLSMHAQAMNDKAQQELNAKLAETQALQRDTLAREDLLRSESTVRAARGANGLSGISPNAAVLFNERRKASDRDRLIQRADDRQRAENYRNAAKAAGSRARWSLATGLVKSAVPIAEYGAYQGWSF
ncbi:MAG: hypothetical protein EP341_00265 [Sphingomonadales bacterium]|nr:MAG: hypothetical protein EP341_00265 [Sphingomonadales bacterium]